MTDPYCRHPSTWLRAQSGSGAVISYSPEGAQPSGLEGRLSTPSIWDSSVWRLVSSLPLTSLFNQY